MLFWGKGGAKAKKIYIKKTGLPDFYIVLGFF